MGRPTPSGMPPPKLRLIGAASGGAVVGVAVGVSTEPELGLIAGLATMSTFFVLTGLLVLYGLDAHETRRHATREDLSHLLDDVLVLVVAIGTVLGIVVLALLGRSRTGEVAAAVALFGVFSGWGMLHSTYAVRYARAYYTDDAGGIDFNNDEDPRFSDFYYFSFNLGMTFQVSDTSVSSARLRRLVLGHCLLSYLFSTVILAATINLVAGIVTGG